MSAPRHIWKFAIDLPAVDGIHVTAHAFFRTSEYGGWVPDTKERSDEFVLHYERGEWRAPPSAVMHQLSVGFGSYADRVARAWNGWTNPPMHLTAAFRPMPAQDKVKVLLEYRLAGPDPALVYQVLGKQLSESIQAETVSLARYLRENLELPALPEVGAT